MDLTLEITKKENQSMANLLMQMCSLKCRSKLDTREGRLSIIGMDDENIEGYEDIIDAIDKTFDIISIDIVPAEEKTEILAEEKSSSFAKEDFSSDDEVYDDYLNEIRENDKPDEEESEKEENLAEPLSFTEDTLENTKLDEKEDTLESVESNGSEGTSEIIIEDSNHKNDEDESSKESKKDTMEDYMAEFLKEYLEKIDGSKEIRPQIIDFLRDIRFSKIEDENQIDNKIIICAMENAYASWHTITISKIVTCVHKDLGIKEDYMVKVMKDEFKKWLQNYPEIKEKYPRMSFVVLLKVLSREYKKNRRKKIS